MPYVWCMKTLIINADGRITFSKAMLKHLGLRPGDKVDVDPQADGSVSIAPLAFERHAPGQGGTAVR